jgi:hypothetical protein
MFWILQIEFGKCHLGWLVCLTLLSDILIFCTNPLVGYTNLIFSLSSCAVVLRFLQNSVCVCMCVIRKGRLTHVLVAAW